MRIRARHAGLAACPDCGSQRLRTKDLYVRQVRHENRGSRRCVLELETDVPLPRLRMLLPAASKNRGLLSLIRRHRHHLTEEQRRKLEAYFDQQPVVRLIYRFKQRLCYLLLKKRRTRRQCEKLIPRFLRAVQQLREAGLAQLVSLGETLWSWREEIVTMWRFTRTNGITEGFHNKMELLKRQAYGFRNFNNYRMRVKILCAGMD